MSSEGKGGRGALFASRLSRVHCSIVSRAPTSWHSPALQCRELQPAAPPPLNPPSHTAPRLCPALLSAYVWRQCAFPTHTPHWAPTLLLACFACRFDFDDITLTQQSECCTRQAHMRRAKDSLGTAAASLFNPGYASTYLHPLRQSLSRPEALQAAVLATPTLTVLPLPVKMSLTFFTRTLPPRPPPSPPPLIHAHIHSGVCRG